MDEKQSHRDKALESTYIARQRILERIGKNTDESSASLADSALRLCEVIRILQVEKVLDS